VGYLRFGEAVKKVTVIKFGVDDIGGNDTGCCGVKVRTCVQFSRIYREMKFG